jgi:hypothetical protein
MLDLFWRIDGSTFLDGGFKAPCLLDNVKRGGARSFTRDSEQAPILLRVLAVGSSGTACYCENHRKRQNDLFHKTALVILVEL